MIINELLTTFSVDSTIIGASLRERESRPDTKLKGQFITA